MPTEIRHILFSPAEMVVAVSDFSRRTGKPLPPGSVVGCRINSAVEDGVELVRFSLSIASAAAAGNVCEQREVTSGGSNLAAALILFCRDRRIPLPSDADKSLRRFGDQVALVVTRNPRRQPVPKITL